MVEKHRQLEALRVHYDLTLIQVLDPDWVHLVGVERYSLESEPHLRVARALLGKS